MAAVRNPELSGVSSMSPNIDWGCGWYAYELCIPGEGVEYDVCSDECAKAPLECGCPAADACPGDENGWWGSGGGCAWAGGSGWVRGSCVGGDRADRPCGWWAALLASDG